MESVSEQLQLPQAQQPAGLISSEDFDRILVWASENRVSDVKVVPGQPLWARQHGHWYPVTRRSMRDEEARTLLRSTSRGDAAMGALSAGIGGYDYSYGVRVSRSQELRFRGNATAVSYHDQISCELTLRTIDSMPPTLAEIEFPEELIEPCIPANGLVLVTGRTGSGKSTTIASVIRTILETQRRSVSSYEEPIEYSFSGLQALGPVSQSEIPTQFPSFAQAARNAARRAADVVFVGESRDRETMESMMETAAIGSAVYSTVHTMSVAATPMRIIQMFRSDERDQKSALLFSQLRVILHQRLVPRVGGGRRVALREWLVVNASHRRKLMETDIENNIAVMMDLLDTEGHPLLRDAEQAHREGQISDEEFGSIDREMRNLRRRILE